MRPGLKVRTPGVSLPSFGSLFVLGGIPHQSGRCNTGASAPLVRQVGNVCYLPNPVIRPEDRNGKLPSERRHSLAIRFLMPLPKRAMPGTDRFRMSRFRVIVSASLVPTYLARRHFLNSARIRAARPGPDWGGPLCTRRARRQPSALRMPIGPILNGAVGPSLAQSSVRVGGNDR